MDYTDSDSPSLCNVVRFLPEMAARVPEQVAVKVPRGRLSKGRIDYEERTFVELEGESNLTARFLEILGITRGTRVLLMVRPGMELILFTFALFKVGAVPIVIDPGMGVRSFLTCVRRSGPEALIGISLAQNLSRFFFPAFRTIRMRVKVDAKTRERVGRIVDRDGGTSSGFEMAPTRADDLAAILFTSGSTGPPKGVRYEHAMFEAQVRLIRDHYGIEPGEVDLPMLPIFALFNPALGMTTVVPEMNPGKPAKVDPAGIVQAVEQCKVTNSFGSPVLWERIARYCSENGLTLPSLRRILMAGAPVSPSLIRQYREIVPNGVVHTPFGATECLPVSSISGDEILNHTWEKTVRGAGSCVGKIMPETNVKVISILPDAIPHFHSALEVANGEIGEIVVSGSVVTKAYDRLEGQNEYSKIRDGDRIWHRLGDLGYFDDDGLLWFCGRVVERVCTSQCELFTDCCEGIFNCHPRVFRSALIGLGTAGQQIPAIVIEPESGHFPKSAREREKFADELLALGAEHEITRSIRRIFFYRNFPVDVRHNAKIHRLSLARYYSKRQRKRRYAEHPVHL